MAQPLTVLIVDDSPEDRQAYRRYLLQDQEYSYTILEEESGEGALKLCQQFQPDAILLDFLLPDLDGLEFMAELKQQSQKTIPAVIMLTGYGNEAVAVQAMKSGVQDYLVKGQTTGEYLRSTMHSAIKNAQLSQELQRSEERFRTSVENMLDCFGIFSAVRHETGQILQFRVDYMNAAACKFSQRISGEQGKYLCKILLNMRENGLFEECCQVIETGQPLVKESLIYTSLNSQQQLTRVIDIRITKMEDGFVAAWRDVTDKKWAEAKLRESQQFIERIADTTPGILYVYDLLAQQNVYTNSQIINLLGYTVPQIQGMDTNFLSSLMHPEDWGRFLEHLQLINVADNGDILEFEYRMRHANGEWRWFFSRDTIFNRNVDGSPRQIVGTAFDITARKQVESELSLSNERFHLAAAAVNCLIYDRDIKNNIVHRTEGLTRILGYSLEETDLKAEWWLEKVHPEDRELLDNQFIDVLDSENYYTVEYRMRHKDQRYLYVLDQGIIVRDPDGEIIRTVGSVTDISERKQAEAALQKSETKFRRIVESNIVGVYFGDFSGGIYEANDAFLEMFGYTRGELEAGNIHWDEMTPPDYQDLDQEKIQELQTSGVCTPFEKEYLRKDGTRVPVLLGIALIGGREKEGYSVCFVLDLTQRKQAEIALRASEERYRYLSNAIPQLVWICNIDGEYDHVNQRWCEFTGQTIEEAMGVGWTKVIHPDDMQIAIQAWMNALQTGKPYEQEMRYKRFDGSYRWHLARGVPIQNEQGRIMKWFGTSTDIDHRKQLEAERNQLLQLEQAARNAAEKANQTKDEFVAMVSHDLRSPLNAILGWAKLLRTRELDPDTITNALETIERNAQSQAKLLEDLLNMSRILRGQLQLEVRPINLVSLVKESVETAYPSANAKGIHLESIIDESIPPIVGDANRLLQVLGNLLSNAIKFTPSGGRVEVRLAQSCESSILIEVNDTGLGIKPEFLPYVFERYRQADCISRHSGLGLGLAIARHLVQLHRGTIQAHSQGEGLGATFTITLPL
ncbi:MULTISPECIES: PAS domain-containing protein [unclassified Nodularia (in: cyanobacteria)]|uniref:PAS domain-containing protein n=1 Tax=unclassified Nodularia (in: cyanobacteria) TaxID=2656917 RepID=UPI00188296AD|nr:MULTISPECIES: PAS domain-containing protein [unclassified Nodularia (in: cyanobacteria)]MBE9200136.1 PAS domain-containing protein [Nodularia sp. LEGE 06071]MCC2693974.1 PAS domain-containing protein [Nodularia sp. LEGE 04288]